MEGEGFLPRAAPPPLLSHERVNGMPFAFNDLTFALHLQFMLLFALCCGLHRRRDKFVRTYQATL